MIPTSDLDAVSGGGLLRSLLGGALQGLAGAVQSGQQRGIWRNVLAGAIQGGASDLAARVAGGEQPAA